MDPMLGVPLLQVLQREGRACAVAQQAFQSWPVGAFDAHRGIDGEAAAVRPAAHLVSVILLDQTAPDEGAQNPLPHECLHIGSGDHIKLSRRMKNHTLAFVRVGDGIEYPTASALDGGVGSAGYWAWRIGRRQPWSRPILVR